MKWCSYVNMQNRKNGKKAPICPEQRSRSVTSRALCTGIYLGDFATFWASGYLFIFTKVVAVTGRALAGGLHALKTSPSSQSFLRTWPSRKVKKMCKRQKKIWKVKVLQTIFQCEK